MAVLSPEAPSQSRSADTAPNSNAPVARSSGKKAFRLDAFINVANTSGAEVKRLPKGERMPTKKEYIEFSPDTKDGYATWLKNYASNILDSVKDQAGGVEKLRALPYATEALKILGVADKKLGTTEYDTAIKEGVSKLLSTPDGWMYTTTLMEQETDFQEAVTGMAIESLPPAQRDVVVKSLEGIWRQLYTGDGEGLVHQLNVRSIRAVRENLKTIGKVLGTSGASSLVGLGTALGTSTGIGALAGVVTSLGIVGVNSASKGGEKITRSPSADRLESIKRNPALAEYIKLTQGVDVNDFNVVDGKILVLKENQNSTQRIGEMMNGAMSNRMTRRDFLTDLGIPPSEQDITDMQGYITGNLERTAERRTKLIKQRFDALGGREAAGTKGGEIAGFIDINAWREKQKVPTEKELRLPFYDSDDFHPRKGAPDRFGQQRSDDKDSVRNVFYGKDDGSELERIGYREEELISSGREFGPTHGITVRPESPDKWGQRPGEAGYGVEKREARKVIERIGKEKTDEIRTTGGHIVDNFDNVQLSANEFTLGFARMAEDDIRTPDSINEDAIAYAYNEQEKKWISGESIVVRRDEAGNIIESIQNRQDIWQQPEYVNIGTADEPNWKRNRFFALVNVNTLRYTDGTPVRITAEQSVVQDPTTRNDLLRREPNSLFYGIYRVDVDGNALISPILTPQSSADNRKPIYKETKNKLGKVIGREFVGFDEDIDVWGQDKDSPFFRRFPGKLLKRYNPYQNVSKEYLQDLHLQDYYVTDPVTGEQIKNPYFARRENTETGRFTPENFDKQYWRDQFDQPYYLPDGKTRNVFFGRASRESFLGARGLPTGLGAFEADPLNLENFSITDLEDAAGRSLPNEFFGRGEELIAKRFGRRRTGDGTFERLDQEHNVMDLTPDSPARDGAGRTESDPRFGLTDEQIRDALERAGEPRDYVIPDRPDYANFNRKTGRDKWGQWPWEPMFCRAPGKDFLNLERTLAGFQGLNALDRHGRREGDEGFGTRGGGENGKIDVPVTLDRLRRARTEVIMHYGEKLLEAEYTNPQEGAIASIKRKIEARKAGGETLEKRKEEARKEIPQFQELHRDFVDRKQTIIDYENKQKELEQAKIDLPLFIERTFGPGISSPDQVKEEIKKIRQESGSRIVIDGREIDSIPDRRRAAAEYLSAESVRIRREYPREKEELNGSERFSESTDAYEERIAGLLKDVRTRYDEMVARYTEDNTFLSQVFTEINSRQESIKQTEALLSPRGDLAAERHTVIYLRPTDRDHATKLVHQSAELRNLLLRGTPDAIKQKIHELHNADPSLGWEEADDDDITKQQLLQYTMTLAKAFAEDPHSVVAFNDSEGLLNDIILQNVTFEELEELPETTLRARLSNAITDDQIIDIKQIAINYADTMRRATLSTEEDLGLRIRRVERQASSISTEEELAELEPMQDLLLQQTDIMLRREDLISNPSKYMPLKTEITPDGVRQYDTLQMWSDLSERERATYTKAEQEFMQDSANADVPVAWLGILHFVSDYQNPNALIYLDPDRNETRETYFKKINELLTYKKFFDLLKYDESRTDQLIAIKGDNIREVLTNFQRSFRLVPGQDADRLAWNRADEVRIEGGRAIRSGGAIPLGQGDMRLLFEDILDNLAKEVDANIG